MNFIAKIGEEKGGPKKDGGNYAGQERPRRRHHEGQDGMAPGRAAASVQRRRSRCRRATPLRSCSAR